MTLEEIFNVLDLMISRAEIWEGPITRRKRLQIWERVEYQQDEVWQ